MKIRKKSIIEFEWKYLELGKKEILIGSVEKIWKPKNEVEVLVGKKPNHKIYTTKISDIKKRLKY